MTLEEIIKEIDNGNRIFVHCDTKEKAIKLLTTCKEKGYMWNGGSELLGKIDNYNGNWDIWLEDTVYFINNPIKRLIAFTSGEYCKGARIPFVYYKTEETPIIKSEYDISFLLN